MNFVEVVIPSVGRPTLSPLLEALGEFRRVIVVDDRSRPDGSLLDGHVRPNVEVVRGPGRGPASARNVGWRTAGSLWVAFLDDDVRLPADWHGALLDDLHACRPDVAGSQGRIRVPLPRGRRPTDWERNVAGLEQARWATADMAYRRYVLDAVGGFDEQLPRAYREDADLGLRVTAAGWRIETGKRYVEHPVRPADRWISVRLQAGNADDVFLSRKHGMDWRRRAGAPAGRRHWHLATSVSLLLAVCAGLTGRRRVATVGLLAYLGLVADFARRRIIPGPRSGDEVATMLVTSPVLPLAASWHWLRELVWDRRRRCVSLR